MDKGAVENEAYEDNEAPYDEDEGPSDKMSNGVKEPLPEEARITIDGESFDPDAQKDIKEPALAPYAGMGKDDLMRFSNTPFWNRLRTGCLIVFWLGWLALLVAIIILTIVLPRCTASPPNDWWQKEVFYQVYVRSFWDSNADGIGDFAGLTAKLDYIQGLGVGALILSAVYPSQPMGDLGYDVIDHKAISADYGTMEDFDTFLKASHDRDVKVILDFVPAHTATDHQWFRESRNSQNYTDPFWNYYIWARNCGAGRPPNNWLSVYGDSAWQFDPVRNECYLRQFLDTQPQLNLRSSGVQKSLEDILRFWLDKEVDGFRVNHAAHLFVDSDLRDEPVNRNCDDASARTRYECLDHVFTTSLPDGYDMVSRWRRLLDEYSKRTGQYRVLITESRTTLNETMDFYGVYGGRGAHLPINFQLTNIDISCGSTCVRDLVNDWLNRMPSEATAVWLTSHQDGPRLSSKIRPDLREAVNVLAMTLPGPPMTYYGEEIGMASWTSFSSDYVPVDPAGRINMSYNRDPYRSPMQWSSEPMAGFMNLTASNETGNIASPWLPVNADYETVNVLEQELKSGKTSLKIYKQLTHLRRSEEAIQFGEYHTAVVNEQIFSYLREFNGRNSFLVAINFGQSASTDDYTSALERIPVKAEVYLSNGVKVEGATADLSSVTLEQGEAIIFTWPYER